MAEVNERSYHMALQFAHNEMERAKKELAIMGALVELFVKIEKSGLLDKTEHLVQEALLDAYYAKIEELKAFRKNEVKRQKYATNAQ